MVRLHQSAESGARSANRIKVRYRRAWLSPLHRYRGEYVPVSEEDARELQRFRVWWSSRLKQHPYGGGYTHSELQPRSGVYYYRGSDAVPEKVSPACEKREHVTVPPQRQGTTREHGKGRSAVRRSTRGQSRSGSEDPSPGDSPRRDLRHVSFALVAFLERLRGAQC